jgi:hypothetical protein
LSDIQTTMRKGFATITGMKESQRNIEIISGNDTLTIQSAPVDMQSENYEDSDTDSGTSNIWQNSISH